MRNHDLARVPWLLDALCARRSWLDIVGVLRDRGDDCSGRGVAVDGNADDAAPGPHVARRQLRSDHRLLEVGRAHQLCQPGEGVVLIL
jgi:hypothetical protein